MPQPKKLSSSEEKRRTPRNKGRLVGQKPPLKPKQVWSIRSRLQLRRNLRDVAMFNLAIDSKLRGCDLIALKVDDVASGGATRDRATIRQKKTGRPVQFEITEQTRQSVDAWIKASSKRAGDYLFTGRGNAKKPLSTRQYARLVAGWIKSIDLDPAHFGTHSLHRTKAARIYRRTGNLRAVQLLLGHAKLESTVR